MGRLACAKGWLPVYPVPMTLLTLLALSPCTTQSAMKDARSDSLQREGEGKFGRRDCRPVYKLSFRFVKHAHAEPIPSAPILVALLSMGVQQPRESSLQLSRK